MEDQPGKHPFYKQFWFWIIISLILVITITIAWITGHHQTGNKENKDIPKNANLPVNNEYSGDIFNASLPDCPADLTGVFTHEVFDLADLDQVNPLGMLSPGGHTIPTDHMNFAHIGTKRMAIYSPGTVLLTFMDDKMTYNSETNQKLHDDYSIEIAPCKGISVWLNHFVEVEPKILQAFTVAQKQCDNGHYHFGNDMGSYYSPCQTAMHVNLEAGELIGYVGQMAGGIVTAATGIDFGAYNYNTPANAFANPARYSSGNLHSFCGLELFTKQLKDAYSMKLGDLFTDGKTVSMIPRVGEPKCGTDMQDIPGTLAGNWFAGTSENGVVTRTQYQLALAHTLSNANVEAISLQGQNELGGNTLMKFTPKHTGTINREWSEVKPGTQVYCYQSDGSENFKKGVGKNGKPMDNPSMKFLIQLTDSTHLRIERKSGSCNNTEQLSNAFTYER